MATLSWKNMELRTKTTHQASAPGEVDVCIAAPTHGIGTHLGFGGCIGAVSYGPQEAVPDFW